MEQEESNLAIFLKIKNIRVYGIAILFLEIYYK